MRARAKSNPFSVPPRRRPARPWRWIALVAVLAAVAGAIPLVGRQWVLHDLAGSLASLPPEQRVGRMRMLAELGEGGIRVLAEAIADEEDALAVAAFETLRAAQDDWPRHGPRAADRRSRRLVEALARLPADLPARRRGWVRQLLSQTLLDTLDSESRAGEFAYREAARMMSELALRGEASEPAAARLATLPELLRQVESDVPSLAPGPQPPDAAPPDSAAGPPEADAAPTEASDDARDREHPSADEPAAEPAELDPVAVSPATILGPTPGVGAEGKDDAEVDSDRPLEPYATREVIDLLDSVRPWLADAASEELRRRGLDEPALRVARQLVSTDVGERLRLVEELPEQDRVDPRRWLLWLADDPERQVRLAAIGVLATLEDPEVEQGLREQLARESDPNVASKIRRALELR